MNDDHNSTDKSLILTPAAAVVGDIIGSTAYSERFVLRLLLKFSEIAEYESTLEEDLCTLWDMTAERDVVDFLLRHDFIALMRFAWPNVRSARTAEIMIGVLANMCCCTDAISSLFTDPTFCNTLLQLVHSDDIPVLVQLLRLINACLHNASVTDAAVWLDQFDTNDFPQALAFILANSANTELLETALETLNIVSSKCNVPSTRAMYLKLFVSERIVDGLHGCFEELVVNQANALERHQQERIFLVSLQLSMNLAGFDKSVEIYESKKNIVCNMITSILGHYSTKIVFDKEIDLDFIDVVQSVNSIHSMLNLHHECDTEKCFELLYGVWKALEDLRSSDIEPSFEDILSGNDVKAFSNQLNGPLCCYLCKFLEACSLEALKRSLATVNKDFDVLLSGSKDPNICDSIKKRIQGLSKSEHMICTNSNTD